MAQPRSASTQTLSVLTLMLSQPREWLHGYELSEQTGLKSGTLYPILMRLSDRGMLDSRWESSPHAGRPPRRMYRLTAQGVSYAKAEASGQEWTSDSLASPGRA